MAMPLPVRGMKVPAVSNELSDEESEFNGFDEELSQHDEKDEEEAELERVIFGTHAGFRQDITRFYENSNTQGKPELVKTEDAAQNVEEDLDTVDDADVRAGPLGQQIGVNCLLWIQLFFIDSGSTLIGKAPAPVSYLESAKKRAERDPAAWEDSDDERMMISLASEMRLRKLRVTEEEDLVNGKEYIWRLRRQ